MRITSAFHFAPFLVMLASYVGALPLKKPEFTPIVPLKGPLPPVLEDNEFVDPALPVPERPSPPSSPPKLMPTGALVRGSDGRLVTARAPPLAISREAFERATQLSEGAAGRTWTLPWQKSAPQSLIKTLPMAERTPFAGPFEPGNRYYAVKLHGNALDEEILKAAKAQGKPFYVVDAADKTIFYNTLDGGKTFTWTDNVQKKDAQFVRNWLSPKQKAPWWRKSSGFGKAAKGDVNVASVASKGRPSLTRSYNINPNTYTSASRVLTKQDALPRVQAEGFAAGARAATGSGARLYRTAARFGNMREALQAPWWKKVASVGTSLRQYLHG